MTSMSRGRAAFAPTAAPLGREELKRRLDALPRVPLVHRPTPLEFCANLTGELGGPAVFVKRDDLTGLAFGGNKVRQLEYLFADIEASGADTVVAGAYTQSNWCRQITAAARKRRLDVALVLIRGVTGAAVQGNLLLDHLMGADVRVIELDSVTNIQPHLDARAGELRAEGRRPYVVAPFGLDALALGALGYVDAAAELDAQLEAAGRKADHLYLAAANMTPAGLLLGLRALGRPTRVAGICPIRWDQDNQETIAAIANAAAERLGLELRISPAEVDIDESFIGEGYGIITPESRAALDLLARCEGIFLDPVYSSKAMAALIEHVRTGRIGRDETVVFLHTGGVPALFAYADRLVVSG